MLTEGLRYCGRGVGYDEVILKGDPMELKVNFVQLLQLPASRRCLCQFIAYYAKEGKVVAVAS